MRKNKAEGAVLQPPIILEKYTLPSPTNQQMNWYMKGNSPAMPLLGDLEGAFSPI